MTSHVEGHLLRRSIPFLESWISELAAARASINGQPATATPATESSKKPKPAKGGKGTAAADDNIATAMSRCCFAVGKVLEVSPHPESTKLFVERIDMGEELNKATANGPRVILSGLQEFVKQEDFVNKLVLVIANLEPRKIAGTPSNGMVLCASTGEDPHNPASADQGERRVVLLDIPEGTRVGERVVFEGHEAAYEPVLKKKLAKNFEEVIAEVRTNADGVVCWKDIPFKTSAGVIRASLNNARIS